MIPAPGPVWPPATGTWSAAGTLAKGRQLHTVTVLPSGKVLVAGGQGSLVFSDAVSKVELYDSASGACRATGGLTTARTAHTAILLPNGSVLFAAGYGSGGGTLSTAELYNPATGPFSATRTLR